MLIQPHNKYEKLSVSAIEDRTSIYTTERYQADHRLDGLPTQHR